MKKGAFRAEARASTMYNQKYTPSSSSSSTKAATATGTNNSSQHQSRFNGTSTSMGSSGTTSQYLHNRSSVRGSSSSSSSHEQQSQNGVGHGNGNTGPMRSPPPTELQRRESLVKPTWANISPGQVPSTTFDELVNNAINSGNASMQQDSGGNGAGTNNVAEGDTQSELGMLSNKLLAKNGLNQRQKKREVELYDIFGKVGTRSEGVAIIGLGCDHWPVICIYSPVRYKRESNGAQTHFR